jgi:signal transduction histidine kinase
MRDTAENAGEGFEKHASDPDQAGTGLGLAIVKQIVEAHGGTVSAESTHGAGATFAFTLPAPLKTEAKRAELTSFAIVN